MLIDFCAWCGKHITPFMFNKIATKELTKKPYWFCTRVAIQNGTADFM